MPCEELFWAKFMPMFGDALGLSLGIVPAILAFWGGMIAFMRYFDRREQGAGLWPRVAEVENRVRAIEARRREGTHG
jgi:hypothetical protein